MNTPIRIASYKTKYIKVTIPDHISKKILAAIEKTSGILFSWYLSFSFYSKLTCIIT